MNKTQIIMFIGVLFLIGFAFGCTSQSQSGTPSSLSKIIDTISYTPPTDVNSFTLSKNGDNLEGIVTFKDENGNITLGKGTISMNIYDSYNNLVYTHEIKFSPSDFVEVTSPLVTVKAFKFRIPLSDIKNGSGYGTANITIALSSGRVLSGSISNVYIPHEKFELQSDLSKCPYLKKSFANPAGALDIEYISPYFAVENDTDYLFDANCHKGESVGESPNHIYCTYNNCGVKIVDNNDKIIGYGNKLAIAEYTYSYKNVGVDECTNIALDNGYVDKRDAMYDCSISRGVVYEYKLVSCNTVTFQPLSSKMECSLAIDGYLY